MNLEERIAAAFAIDEPSGRDRAFEAEALAAAAAMQARRNGLRAVLRACLTSAGGAVGLLALLYLAPPAAALPLLAPVAACLCGFALVRAWAPGHA